MFGAHVGMRAFLADEILYFLHKFDNKDIEQKSHDPEKDAKSSMVRKQETIKSNAAVTFSL